MKSIIKEFYLGQTELVDAVYMDIDRKYKAGEISELDQTLREMLGKKEMKVYEKLFQKVQWFDITAGEHLFAEGFTIGLRLGAEAFSHHSVWGNENGSE